MPEQSVGFVRDSIFYDYFPDDDEHIANLRDRYDGLLKEYGRTLMALARAHEEIERLRDQPS